MILIEAIILKRLIYIHSSIYIEIRKVKNFFSIHHYTFLKEKNLRKEFEIIL